MSDDREHEVEQSAPVDDEPDPAPQGDPPIKDEHWTGAVEDWINSHLRGSPVSTNTGAWNWLMQKLPHLREALHKRMEGE